MKIQTRIYSRKLPESIQNAISFDIIQVKNFKTFMERPSLVVILCLRQWHIFQKWGVFQRSKGRGHEKFSRGQAPGPPLWLASLAPRLSPPNINFVPTGLIFFVDLYLRGYLALILGACIFSSLVEYFQAHNLQANLAQTRVLYHFYALRDPPS